MIIKEPMNRDMRLFSLGETTQYLGGCYLWRVMFTRGALIVKCRFYYLNECLSVDGKNLHVVHAECRDPSEYIQEDVVMRFADCKTKRHWLINPKDDYSTHNIEFEFSNFWIKEAN